MRLFSFVLVFLYISSSQTIEHQICATNIQNQVYAIIDINDYDDELFNSEAYADFIYHTNKFKESINIPVKVYINKDFKLNDKPIPKGKKSVFQFIYIKQGNNTPFIVEGVDTDVGLFQAAERFFGKEVVRKKNTNK